MQPVAVLVSMDNAGGRAAAGRGDTASTCILQECNFISESAVYRTLIFKLLFKVDN